MIGSFELQVETLLNERVSGVAARKRAEGAFLAIKGLFNSTKSRGGLGFQKTFNILKTGEFAVDLRDHGAGAWFPGVLHFIPDRGHVYTAGIGKTKSGVPVIRFQSNLPAEEYHYIFTNHFDTRWAGMRSIFVHEYAHWLDELKQRGRNSGNAAMKSAEADNLAGYINTPEEMQAFFIEVTDWFHTSAMTIRKWIGRDSPHATKVRNGMLGETFRDFLKKAKKRFKMWEFLTPANQKRLIKRFSGTWYELNDEIDAA